MKYTLTLFLILVLWCWYSHKPKFEVVETVTFNSPGKLNNVNWQEFRINHQTVMDDHGHLIEPITIRKGN